MSLNLTEKPQSASEGRLCTDEAFTNAVNDAQFVRTFGIVALLGSILTAIYGPLALGPGIAVIRYGPTRYYRLLGGFVIALAVSSFCIGGMGLLAMIVLTLGVGWKGIEILSTLGSLGRADPDWAPTRKRAITGIVLSGISMLVAAAWLTLFLITVINLALRASGG